MPDPTNPLIVQSDFSLYLEVFNPKFETVRNGITKFAELDKSPEYVHTYKISALSIWNAASSGIDIEDIVSFLDQWSKIDVPKNVITEMRTIYKRFCIVEILKCDNDQNMLILHIREKNLETEVLSNPKLKKFLLDKISDGYYHIDLL
ncbi:MAG: helicase-associated domain-containing protein, partial [Spirochaetales bacterium]|nr:helicase-associated domain-containing protein [Spirochaetales bacterium]